MSIDKISMHKIIADEVSLEKNGYVWDVYRHYHGRLNASRRDVCRQNGGLQNEYRWDAYLQK